MAHGRIARKITSILFLVQSLSSAGFIAVFTVNALVGAELSGLSALAGVPEAVRVLGQALAAVAWGYTFDGKSLQLREMTCIQLRK